jgi:5-methyltetrahydropteroyltriglutamate--homocysteine methyltransferase
VTTATTFRSPGIHQLLPTSVVGSHPIPSWVWSAQAEIQLGHYGDLDRKDVWEDAARVAILDQEMAGIDLISDGEIGRTEFIARLLGLLRNLEIASPSPRQVGQPSYDSIPTFRTTGTLHLEPGAGFGTVREWDFARRIATAPLKVTIPGPYTLAAYIQPGEGYESWAEVVWDLAGLVNAEARQLAAAGVAFVQIDEPLVVQECNAGAYTGDIQQAVSILNRTLEGVATETGLHVCFGNNRRAPYARRKYAGVYPALLGVGVQQFLHEYVNRGMDEIDLWTTWGDDRALAVGVVDDKNYYIETAEEVAETIRVALRYVAPDKLWLTPDCGLRNQPRYIGVAKLYALANGAEIVRAELEGRPPELRDGLRGGRLVEVTQRARDFVPPARRAVNNV